MRIIGIGGLENSESFKRRHWPGLPEREYRISQGRDSAAALVIDGVLVAAAAEERFSGQKHTGDFPAGAIRYCLSEAGITLDQIDRIVHAFDYAPFQALYSLDPTSTELYREVLSKDSLLRSVGARLPGFPPDRVSQVGHHLSHAASAYFTSGFEECLVVVLDGMGETQSASVYHAHDGVLDKIREIPAHDSIGILYSLVTLHLGFDFNADEYKIMGLAPYGDPRRFRAFFEQAVELRPDGSIRIPILHLNRTRDEWENYTRTRQYLGERLITQRAPESEITGTHCDVAAALQDCLSRAVLHICGQFGARTGLRKLALAGGVALNCTANGRLMCSGSFDEIYIQPAAGDDGAALGAALYFSSQAGETVNRRMPVPFFGPVYSQDEIETAIQKLGDRIHAARIPTLEGACARAATLIAQRKVVAWYRGRMEFGPRALGNRSILADPSDPKMRDRVNEMVKKREGFRPFAPAVSIEQVHQWFEVPPGTQLPYMIATVRVRPEHRAQLPAVTHVDGSARVQTVSARDNHAFHTLLRSVGAVSGREMVLNTSFNVKGQPMVNTPGEALATFLGTGIDALFLDNTLITRRGEG